MDKLYFVRDGDSGWPDRSGFVNAPDATRALHLWRSHLFDQQIGEMFDVPMAIYEVSPAGAARGVILYGSEYLRDVTAEAGLEVGE